MWPEIEPMCLINLHSVCENILRLYLWKDPLLLSKHTTSCAQSLMRNVMGGGTFPLPLSWQVLSPFPHRIKPNRRQLECCPIISSPGVLIKYSRGSHLVGNTMQSRKKGSACWCALATRQRQAALCSHSQCQGFNRPTRPRAFSLFPVLSSLALLLLCSQVLHPQYHQPTQTPDEENTV